MESNEIDLFQDDIQEENQEDGDTGGNGETQPSGADSDLTNEHPVWYKLIYFVANIGPFT